MLLRAPHNAQSPQSSPLHTSKEQCLSVECNLVFNEHSHLNNGGEGVEEAANIWSLTPPTTAPSKMTLGKTGLEILSPIVANPSFFSLQEDEAYLLDYFTYGVTPRCTTWAVDNPFARTMLPLCISSLGRPIFNTILAVASQQHSLLEGGRFKTNIWIYRGKALRSLQAEMGRVDYHQKPLADWEHVVSTLVMLTFFDVSCVMKLLEVLEFSPLTTPV